MLAWAEPGGRTSNHMLFLHMTGEKKTIQLGMAQIWAKRARKGHFKNICRPKLRLDSFGLTGAGYITRHERFFCAPMMVIPDAQRDKGLLEQRRGWNFPHDSLGLTEMYI